MNIKHLLPKLIQTIGLSCSILLSANAYGAPGTLPTAPLLLTNAVEPNVFFVVDDSYSMHWETMMDVGVAGLTVVGGDPKFFVRKNSDGVRKSNRTRYLLEDWIDKPGEKKREVIPPPFDSTIVSPNITEQTNLWAARFSGANKVYYNPNVDYEPWQGTDASGNAYADALVGAVLQDPNVPVSAGGKSTNLNNKVTYKDTAYCNCDIDYYVATYYTWTDDGDGIMEAGEETKHVIPTDTSFPSGRSQAKELENFANWLQYYRSRYLSAKAALGNVINSANATRMGLDLFLDGTQTFSNGQISQSMTSASNKKQLMDNLYQAGYDWGTPTRSALIRVGEHFLNPSAHPDPIFSAADGGECQQNFSVVMTDGFWTNETITFGNADKDGSAKGDSIFDGNELESNDGGNYQDDESNTLADIAMYYYETDLRSGFDPLVPTISGVDENPQQHLVTYGVAFGVNGKLDPKLDNPADTSDPIDPTKSANFWPTDLTIKEHKIDDLWHASYNARGQFLSAQNPVELQLALGSAIKDISQRTSSASAVAVNSARLTSDSVVYLAQFNSDKWQGSLFSYPIIDSNLGTLADDPTWEANKELTDRLKTNKSASDSATAAADRQIITFDGTKGVPFTWTYDASTGIDSTDISTAMQNDLRQNPLGGIDGVDLGAARLNYLRGDITNETNGLRPRTSMLGDLVNSGPVFVGDPTLSWPDAAPFPTGTDKYSDFKASKSGNGRDNVVYIGSNDGMLHAIDDSNGKEIFAYVPNLLASSDLSSGYHYLTDPNYSHQWFVDLTPTLSDINITTGFGAGWHTILIGGLRGGGRGLFALDVTNPSSLTQANAEQIAMWEFSDADDNDLGYTYSRPTIALANNGRWVAIFGNGYNDQGTSGTAQLFILDIEKGIDGWVAGDYKKIDTKKGSTSDRNGLSSPAIVDIDGNGTVDRVYAGDLQGNMWAFDLSSSSSGSWKVATKSGSTPTELFKTPSGQPITAKPVLAKHPTIPFSNSDSPNLMVYFGSGQYLVDADKQDDTVHSFYGVWDKGTDERNISHLVEQTFVPGYSAGRVLSNNAVDYSTVYGWHFKLNHTTSPAPSERSVTTPIARADTVFFNSFIPQNDPCSVGGFGFRFAVDMATGGSPNEPVFDLNDDGEVSDLDKDDSAVIAAVRQEGYLPEPVFIEDLVFTGEVADKIKKLPDVPTGRFSWQELIK